MPLGFDFKILLTMVNRNKIERSVVEMVKNLYKERCFSTTIRHQAKPITEASLNKDVLLAVSNSPVAQDYQMLVDEVIEKEFFGIPASKINIDNRMWFNILFSFIISLIVFR